MHQKKKRMKGIADGRNTCRYSKLIGKKDMIGKMTLFKLIYKCAGFK